MMKNITKQGLEVIAISILCEKIDFSSPTEGRVHNWWNYIPSEIQDIWNELDDETKVISGIVAATMANREEWD